MAAMLAVAAVFAAGLTILPSTVQDAHADFDITDICEDNNQNQQSQVKCEDFAGVFRGDN